MPERTAKPPAPGKYFHEKEVIQGWNRLFSSSWRKIALEPKIAQGTDAMAAKNATVVHNASNQRFEINIDGQLSILEYTFKNHRLFLTQTEVPPALESQGLGTELAHAALEYARQNDLTVVVLCPFVKEYVGSHPEYQSFVTTSVA